MKLFVISGILASLLLAACSESSETATVQVTEPEVLSPEREFNIVTLLPKDAIPAIFDPSFVSGEEADLQYEPDELVIGVEFDGNARAYSIPMLSSHEIVNDTVGGRKIAVTW